MWKEIDEMNKNTHGHIMPEQRRQRWALRKLEMAARLMEQVQTYGKAADDMTILVVGIWKR